MSRKFFKQFADPRGLLIEEGIGRGLYASGTTVPADASAGYLPGCVFIDTDATLGGQMFWLNEGTVSSSKFRPAGSLSVIAAGSTLTLTGILHANNKIINLDTTSGSVVTLPAASGTGNVFRFRVSVIATTNSHVVKVANASDAMEGFIFTMSDDPATVKGFFAIAGTDDTITLNRSTTGSVTVGEQFSVTDVATNRFLVEGFTSSTGSEATPFSATV